MADGGGRCISMAAKLATARRYKRTYTLYVTCTATNKQDHGLQGSPLSWPQWTESAATLQSQRQRRHVRSSHTAVVESKRVVFTPSTPYKEHETRRGGDGGATDIDGHDGSSFGCTPVMAAMVDMSFPPYLRLDRANQGRGR
jgi:hypothetical protein